MSRSRNKKPKAIKFLDLYDKIRKPGVPLTKVINPKKKYDRRDKSWMENNDEDEESS